MVDKDPCIRCRIKCQDLHGGEGCVLIPEQDSERFLINIFKETPRDQRPHHKADGRETDEEIGWKAYVITDHARVQDCAGKYHSIFTLGKVRGFDLEKERKKLEERRARLSRSSPRGRDAKPQHDNEEITC